MRTKRPNSIEAHEVRPRGRAE